MEHIIAEYGNRYTDDSEFVYTGYDSPANNEMEYIEFTEDEAKELDIADVKEIN